MATYTRGASVDDMNSVRHGGQFMILQFRRIWQEKDPETMRHWYLDFEYSNGVIQSFKLNKTTELFKNRMNFRPSAHYIVWHSWGVISRISDMFRFTMLDSPNKIFSGNLYNIDELKWENPSFLYSGTLDKQKYVDKLSGEINEMLDISKEFLTKADDSVFDLLFPYRESTHWFRKERDKYKENGWKWKQFDWELKKVEERNAKSRQTYLKLYDKLKQDFEHPIAD